MNILEIYESAIEQIDNIERKGKTMPYTSVNGNMFSFIDKEDNLSIRLPEEERLQFIEKHKTKLSEQHGRIMKEYVLVPNDLFTDTKLIVKYFQMSFDSTLSLKPKKK